jgi:hypothetical protein
MCLRLRKSWWAATAVVAVVLALVAVGCGSGSPRIVVSLKPLPTLTFSRCTIFIFRLFTGGRMVQRHAYARSTCAREAVDANWYHARVTNEGGRATWVYCGVVAYDARGRRMWVTGLPLTPSGFAYAAVDLDPGKSSALTWFIPQSPGHPLPAPVARYKATCHTTKTPPV